MSVVTYTVMWLQEPPECERGFQTYWEALDYVRASRGLEDVQITKMVDGKPEEVVMSSSGPNKEYSLVCQLLEQERKAS